MNPLRWSYRPAYLLGFAICVALMAYALYAEVYLGLVPCPLCVFQRMAFIVMGIFFLVGGLHAPASRWRWLYTALVLVGCLWGIAVASRQLWLQSLPADLVPSCGPGLGYLFDTFSWTKALKIVFAGSGECAAVHWRFLGLTMPGWTLIWYVVLGAWALWGASLGRRSRRLVNNAG